MNQPDKIFLPGTAPSSAGLGLLFCAVVFVFWPFGLDQFELPKQLVILVGTPMICAIVVARPQRPTATLDLPMSIMAIAFLAVSAFAPLATAENHALHLLGTAEAFVLIVLCGASAISRTQLGRSGEKPLLGLMGLPGIAIALMAIAQGLGVDPVRLLLQLSSSRPGRWQTLTTLGNPTWTAEIVACCVPFLMSAASSTKRARGYQFAVGALSVAAIAMTGSRGGLLGLCVGLVVWSVLQAKNQSATRILATATLVAVIVFGAGIVTVASLDAERLTEMAPLSGRLALWAAGASLVAETPLTGRGIGSTTLVLSKGLRTVVASVDPANHQWLPTVLVDRFDNDWIQIAVERGVPAALLLLFLCVRGLILASRRALMEGSTFDEAIAASLAVLATCSLFSAPLHTPATTLLFWILLGFVAVPTERHQRQQPRRWPFVAVCGVAMVIACILASVAVSANNHAGAGHRLLQSGRPGPAETRLAAALSHLPWFTAASVDRATALVTSGRCAEALVVIDDAEGWAHSQRLWAIKADALNQLGFPDEARRVLDDGIRVLPRSTLLLQERETFCQSGSLVHGTTNKSPSSTP